MTNSVSRFSNRVENYAPLPAELSGRCDRHSEVRVRPYTRVRKVADIGSGTGISSELFLKNGNPVLWRLNQIRKCALRRSVAGGLSEVRKRGRDR